MNRSSQNRLPVRQMLVCFFALLAVVFFPLAITGQDALKAGMKDPATGKVIKYWVAPMDPTYIRYEPGQSPMGMDLVPVFEEEGGEKEPSSTIRIDPVTVQNMGLRLGRVKEGPMVRRIRTFGTVTYDEIRIYTVNTKYDGWIEALHVQFEGESVQKGQPLFELYSPELVRVQEEYLLAMEQRRTAMASPYEQIRSAGDQLFRASQDRLRYLDFTDGQIESLESAGKPPRTLTVYAPADGVVISKKAFAGHFVKAGEHQFEIADLSTVWVDVDVYEYELPYVRKGMPAAIELAYLPGSSFTGTVLFVYPYLNAKTRTVRLRLSFPNPEGKLKPEMYANVYLESAVSDRTLIIPQEAVIDSGVRKVVFVARGKGRFEPREVRVGAEGENGTLQVLSGLSAGDEIVVSAQFMLDSESRLREAVQKMLDVAKPDPADDLDMEGMTMDDDLDIENLTMDDMPK